MKINILILLGFCFITKYTFGQNTFKLTNSSEKYFVIINVSECDSWYCKGNGTVKVYDKRTNKFRQSFSSENLFTELNKESKKPTENHHQLYDGTSAIIFNDFNFDGFEDLAIRNGNLGSYSGPSYDIYIYKTVSNKFKLDEHFTSIATHTGMFFIDKKRKRLITHESAGYSTHITEEYKIQSGKPLKVKIITEESTYKNEVIITTKVLVKNKWKASPKKYVTSKPK